MYDHLYSLLPKSRKGIAAKRTGLNKKIAIIEYFIVKNALNLSDDCDFQYDKNGKPFIIGYNFSISHSNNQLCVAVQEYPVGVDIEKKLSFNSSLLNYVLNSKEKRMVENSNDPEETFTKLWVQKEATIKCLGLSLATPLPSLLDEHASLKYKFYKKDDFYICECIKEN